MAKHKQTKHAASNMPHPNPALNFATMPRAGSTFGDSTRSFTPVSGINPPPEEINPTATPQLG